MVGLYSADGLLCERVDLNFGFLCGRDRNVCASKDVGCLPSKGGVGLADTARTASLPEMSRESGDKSDRHLERERERETLRAENRIYFPTRCI